MVVSSSVFDMIMTLWIRQSLVPSVTMVRCKSSSRQKSLQAMPKSTRSRKLVEDEWPGDDERTISTELVVKDADDSLVRIAVVIVVVTVYSLDHREGYRQVYCQYPSITSGKYAMPSRLL